MRLFKRIRHEGLRRLFVLATAAYAIFWLFFLWRFKANLYDGQYKAYIERMNLGVKENAPQMFHGMRDILDFAGAYAICVLGGILVGYLVILAVQWAIAGFAKKD